MHELALIEAFVAIVENGSQLAAANALDQTGAAINKKLNKLETKLGVQLLERDNKGSQLTPIGNRYYEAYKEILEKISEADQIAKLSKAKPSGRLMVSTNRGIAHHLIVPHLNVFLKKYPDIFLVIDIAEKPIDYIPGKQDILIAPDNMIHENLVRKKLFTTRDMICSSKTYLKNNNVPKKLSDLHQLDYIGQCTRAPLNRIQLDTNKCIEISKPFIRVNDTQTEIELALNHLGFIYVKEYQILPYLKSGALIEILPHLNKSKINISLYYHHQQYVDPKIRVFIEHFSNIDILKN